MDRIVIEEMAFWGELLCKAIARPFQQGDKLIMFLVK